MPMDDCALIAAVHEVEAIQRDGGGTIDQARGSVGSSRVSLAFKRRLQKRDHPTLVQTLSRQRDGEDASDAGHVTDAQRA